MQSHIALWHLLGIDFDTGIGWLDGLLAIIALVVAFLGIGWLMSLRHRKAPPKASTPRASKKNSN